MTAPGRMFLDVSYTRMQRGNVGITRTVRRLLEELRFTTRCTPVVFHRSGYRQLPEQLALGQPHVEQEASMPARLFRWVGHGTVRRAASLLPLAVLRPLWAFVSARLFNSAAAQFAPVVFAPGDWLVIADESWNYPAWKAARKPGDPAGQYRFYRFVPERVKILDEAEFGDAVFVQAAIVRG